MTLFIASAPIPFCSLDGRHRPALVIEYMDNNGKRLPIYGSWYCLICRARLDNIPFKMAGKHERFREVQRAATENLNERFDEQ